MMDIKYVYVKTRSEFGKQCIFDICGPNLDEEIKPNPQEMRNYIVKSQCHVNTQYTKQIALHEVRSISLTRLYPATIVSFVCVVTVRIAMVCEKRDKHVFRRNLCLHF